MEDKSHSKNEVVLPVARRGFVTIATGNQKYYQLALNLLRSYRQNSNDPSPFALICDRNCPEAQEFDYFVLIDDPNHSYLDKLLLDRYTPYEETIFIDADSLILKDTTVLWDDYADHPDFSCYGATLPLTSKEGWFFYENMGELKPQLSFCVSMHGGLYYLRKSSKCTDIFEKARYFAENYHNYTFSRFLNPADEPVLALSMALAGNKPCPSKNRILFLPRFDDQFHISYNGVLMLKRKPCEAIILHFGNRNIHRFLYQYLLATNEFRSNGNNGVLPNKKRIAIRLVYLPDDTKVLLKRFTKKILPRQCINLLKRVIRK